MTGWGESRKQMQLWPKTDSQCTLTDFPLEVHSTVGFWTAQGPTVCGGNGGENKCFLYREHQWMPSTNLGTARNWASALQIDSNQALIIGGRDKNWNDLYCSHNCPTIRSVHWSSFVLIITFFLSVMHTILLQL